MMMISTRKFRKLPFLFGSVTPLVAERGSFENISTLPTRRTASLR
ncbi:unnamed protein product [Ectocarpus sp. 12 AP-2014]